MIRSVLHFREGHWPRPEIPHKNSWVAEEYEKVGMLYLQCLLFFCWSRQLYNRNLFIKHHFFSIYDNEFRFLFKFLFFPVKAIINFFHFYGNN